MALNAASGNNPLLHPDFVAASLYAFGTGHELLAVLGSPGDVTAFAILTSQGPGRWHTFQPSQAPMGFWLQKSGLALEDMLRSLVRALPGKALLLSITQQDPDVLPRPTESSHMRTLDYIPTARITVSGRFEDYWSARGKNLRHNMKRQRNRLAKLDIATRLSVTTEPAQISEAIADYGKLETSGWKADEGTAVARDNAQGKFYQDLLQRFAASGAARVYRYFFNDSLVAMDLCIDHAGTLVILKTAYDENQKEFSPAMLMRQDAFDGIFHEGRTQRIEFYGRVMDWHTKWSDEIRTMYHLNYYRWPLLATLHRSFARR